MNRTEIAKEIKPLMHKWTCKTLFRCELNRQKEDIEGDITFLKDVRWDDDDFFSVEHSGQERLEAKIGILEHRLKEINSALKVLK